MPGNAEAPETPTKHSSSLYSTPQKAERYVKKYSSVTNNSTIKDPKQFNLRPGVWQEWEPSRLTSFIEYLQKNVDLMPFAREQQIPLEEVQEVFQQTICQDLYTTATAACARLRRRMKEQIKLRNEKGEPLRRWGGTGIAGELYKVRLGTIELVTPEENEVLLNVDELSQGDLDYLKQVLNEEEWKFLRMNETEVKKQLSPGFRELDCEVDRGGTVPQQRAQQKTTTEPTAVIDIDMP